LVISSIFTAIAEMSIQKLFFYDLKYITAIFVVCDI
jgi:hypothetical protein